MQKAVRERAADKGQAQIQLTAGTARQFVLKPFEVVTLDAEPVK